jgi:hypothetical protein
VLVSADDRHIAVAVDTRKELLEIEDDGTPDAGVPEGYI